jgi:hypothetical protein
LPDLEGKNDTIDGEMNLSFKNDKEFIKAFNEFVTGKTLGTLEISEKHLIDGELWLGGLKFLDFGELSKIKFESIPTYTNKIDLRFDDGFEYNGIKVKVFYAVKLIEIHAEIPNANFTIQLIPTELNGAKINFTYTHKKLCNKISEEVNLFTLLNNLGEGKLFTAFIDNGKSFSRSFTDMKPLLKDSKFFLEYFSSLKTIVKHFNIQFLNFDFQSINSKSYDDVLTLLAVINGKKEKYNWDIEISFGLKEGFDQTIEQLKKINREGTPVAAFGSEWVEIELHGQKIGLGYKVIELIEPHITNIDSFLDKKDDVIKVKSRINKVYISYTDKNDPN